MEHLDEALRLAREATAPTGVTPGTYQNATVTVRADGRLSDIEEGESASSLDVAESITRMDGSLGGTWWFQRDEGAVGSPTTIYVHDGLTKADGSALQFRLVVVCQEALPEGESWRIDYYKYAGGEWVSIGSTSAAAGAKKIVSGTFTLAEGQQLACATIADGVGPSNAQLQVRRG